MKHPFCELRKKHYWIPLQGDPDREFVCSICHQKATPEEHIDYLMSDMQAQFREMLKGFIGQKLNHEDIARKLTGEK